MQRYFPQGLAEEEFFCNREKERNLISKSILSHEHLVLVAPRRYGKTSLIAQVLRENNFPGINIDLFFVLSQGEVSRIISDSVAQLINKMLPKSSAVTKKVVDTLAMLNPKVSFNLLGQKLEINVKQSTTEKNISELLLILDQFAIKFETPCVIAFDEFQQIGELKENHTIEASIRHAVERSKNVSYIFCGSNRHLLNEMFSDRTRPLYHLCDLMTINRIGAESYKTFLNDLSKSRWKQLIMEDVLDEILNITECHPYYVNALCRRLWSNEAPPKIVDVVTTWENYVAQQSSWIIGDFSRLTLTQRKLLTALVLYPTSEPHGEMFSMVAKMTPSTIQKTLQILHRMDLVYQDCKNQYKVLDPAVAYFIRQRFDK
ncbi:MAG: ATP-binding protein [Burkholderiales bacterium]|nr:ATP-binding protein [Burkholderiales bacterium]